MLDLTRSTFRRAGQVRLPQAAASLTLTTALSIVPLLAVGFAVFRRFPVFRPLEVALEQHLLKSLLPADISGAVLKYLHQFATNANGLTLVGSLFVLAGAVMMLLTVEGALNQMWDIKQARPLPRRLGLYLLMLAVGPAIVGASLWATATLLDASMGRVRSGRSRWRSCSTWRRWRCAASASRACSTGCPMRKCAGATRSSAGCSVASRLSWASAALRPI